MSHWPWTILVAATEVAAFVAILSILRRPREPRAMLAWILALLLMPGVGLVLFLLIGERRMLRHQRRRRRRRKPLTAPLTRRAEALQSRELIESRQAPATGVRQLMALAEHLGSFPATAKNEVTVFHDAEKTFLALQLAIEAAESHVHLEYYIFQPDETGTAVADMLIAKARQGVQCRLLLDFIGCWRLSRRFVRRLRKAGVQVAFAMPVLPWRGRWRVNFRNHRKIAVIDGRVGFTGSQNIGDEYRGRRARISPWRDTHLRIVGPGVHHLQEVFVEDWHYTTKEDLVTDEYFPIPPAQDLHTVQVVPSGPDQPIHVTHHVVFAAIQAARSSIHVITPYFVPDAAVVVALQAAAYRGVEVCLIIPTLTDQRVVLWAGRSFYESLCRAGVEIYEHDETMLHSKVMIVDREWAMVGSANMDERSFRINFEVSTMLYSMGLAEELYDDLTALRERSRRIHVSDLEARSFAESIGVGLARLASPLL